MFVCKLFVNPLPARLRMLRILFSNTLLRCVKVACWATVSVAQSLNVVVGHVGTAWVLDWWIPNLSGMVNGRIGVGVGIRCSLDGVVAVWRFV